MATNAALASTRIPTNARLLPSKASHSFASQCAPKRLEVAKFSCLRSTSCLAFGSNAPHSYFFDVAAAQLSPQRREASGGRVETVAKLKVAINGFGRIGRNFLRYCHGRKDSP